MKKEQNRYSLHLIRQNVPQFILLVIFSVLLGVSVIAVSVLMKMFLDIATNACTMPLTTCLIIAVGVLLVLGISQVVTSVLQGKLSCRMELSLRKPSRISTPKRSSRASFSRVSRSSSALF